jgi:nitrate reductase delta subunit
VASELVRIADLLCYPDERLTPHAADRPEVIEFFDEIARVAPEGMEELYTRTFDLNPVATLEVGWHLWGEQYERGRFLAELRALQEDLGVDAGNELPDHLTAVLATLARLDQPDTLAEKISPALQKIAAPLEEQGNPYRHLIRAVRTSLAVLRTAAVPAADAAASRAAAALGGETPPDQPARTPAVLSQLATRNSPTESLHD